MTNEELALYAQDGDVSALHTLWGQVERLATLLASRFFLRVGADAAAQRGVEQEDLQQEAFFGFLAAVQAYKPEKGHQFTTYLSHTTGNRFRALLGLRGAKRPLNEALSLNVPLDEESTTEWEDTLEDPEAWDRLLDKPEGGEVSRLLAEILGNLTEAQREVLLRRYAAQQPAGEIATVKGCTPAEVKKLAEGALRAVRQHKSTRALYLAWK